MKSNKVGSFTMSRLIIELVLIIGSFIMILPFLWMLMTSLKSFPETMKLPIVWIPEKLRFENYANVLNKMNFSTYYLNTIIVTVSITLLQLIICSMAAFGFARLNAPGKNVIFVLTLCFLMVPIQMTIIPNYVLLNRMGVINTRFVMIFPRIFSVYGTFFLKQFFETLPRDLEESARIDGCSYFRCYWNISLPLCGTALFAFGIFTVLWAWNDMLWPLVMTSSEKYRILSVAIASMVGQYSTKTNEMMAASVMAVFPMIILFIVFQKQFISSIATTGLKG